MKKVLLVLVAFIPITWYLIITLIGCKNYRRDSRHFFCLKSGHCVTMWRTLNGVCYIIPGRYTSSTCPPSSESYIISPFKESLDIIWPKDSDNIIVSIDEKSQVIHQSPNGIKIIDYNSNKKHNDSLFLCFDGNYERYKKDVDFMTIEIFEEYAYGKMVKE